MTNSTEIRIITKGPTPETEALTLAVTFTFSPSSVAKFKKLVPYWRHDNRVNRWWDEKARIWYARHEYLDTIKAFALDFDGAMLIDGNRWENLRTGQVYEQQTLFDDMR